MEQAPFVGRVAALERLAGALAAAGSGRGSTVLVGGEAGIGKSRVAAELAARAATRVGSCWPAAAST